MEVVGGVAGSLTPPAGVGAAAGGFGSTVVRTKVTVRMRISHADGCGARVESALLEDVHG